MQSSCHSSSPTNIPHGGMGERPKEWPLPYPMFNGVENSLGAPQCPVGFLLQPLCQSWDPCLFLNPSGNEQTLSIKGHAANILGFMCTLCSVFHIIILLIFTTFKNVETRLGSWVVQKNRPQAIVCWSLGKSTINTWTKPSSVTKENGENGCW